MKRRDGELFVFLAGVTILTPLLSSMGVPWSVRLPIYLAPAVIILLYEWFHRADRRAKADKELLAAVGSIETINALRQNYPALDWSFRNHNSEMVAKIAAHAREAGRITAEQAAALERLAAQWDRA